MRWIGVAAACVLVAGLGVASYAAWDLSSTFAANAVDLEGQESTPPDIGSLVESEGVDILLTGIDICEWDSHEKFGARCPQNPEAYGEDGREIGAGLNDVNMLVHVSPEPRKITAIAFPRDLLIPTPECTDPKTGAVTAASSRKMINESYIAGGLPCVVKTIDSLTTPHDRDLAVDYAATVTWNGVIEITNAIGGVDVCVDGTINDREAGMLYLTPGTHTLAGEQALAFLRSRHGVGDGGDQSRISNQQVYLSSLARKLKSDEVLTNPGRLLSLARTTLSNVDPSSSLTNPMTLVQIALAVKDVPTSEIVFLQYPAVQDPADPNRLVPIEEDAAALFAALKENAPVSPTGKYLEEEQEAAQPSTPPADAGGQTAQPTETPTAPAPDNLLGRTADDTSCSQANN
jgi:LCP family protein required for cell wall assembly